MKRVQYPANNGRVDNGSGGYNRPPKAMTAVNISHQGWTNPHKPEHFMEKKSDHHHQKVDNHPNDFGKNHQPEKQHHGPEKQHQGIEKQHHGPEKQYHGPENQHYESEKYHQGQQEHPQGYHEWDKNQNDEMDHHHQGDGHQNIPNISDVHSGLYPTKEPIGTTPVNALANLQPSPTNTGPGKSKMQCNAFNALTIFLIPFGFDLYSERLHKFARLYQLPLRLLLLGCNIFWAYTIYVCMTARKSIIVKPGCNQSQTIPSAIDTILTAACFFALLCHFDTIRRLLRVSVNAVAVTGDLVSETRAESNIRCLKVLSAGLMVFSVLYSVGSTAAMAGMDMLSLFGWFRFYPFFAAFMPMFMRVFVCHFVSLMSVTTCSAALALGNLSQAISGSGRVGGVATIEENYRRVARLIYHLNACFSGLLPVLLGTLLAEILFWAEQFTGPNVSMMAYIRIPCVVWNIWLLILILTPIFIVNAKVQTPHS